MPMTLRQKQSKFVEMLARLIDFAVGHGYELTLGESFDDDNIGHMKNSLHYIRLAQDFNLFINGVFQDTTEAHRPLGEYWESIGGSWGGRWGDGNHYSLGHEGRK